MTLKAFLKSSILLFLNQVTTVLPVSFTRYILRRFFRITLQVQRERKEITVCRYKNGAKGAFCFSIDYDVTPRTRKRIPEVTKIFSEAVKQIVQLSEAHNVPLTWGICGETALQDKPLLKRILASTAHHEIGVHTFSHLDLSSEMHQPHQIRSDIVKCLQILDTDRPPASFIFPYNREKHHNILRELSFIAFRGCEVEGIRMISPPIFTDKLWNIPETFYLSEWSIDEVSIIRGLIDIAIAYEGVFHLWTHPWNLHHRENVNRFMNKVVQPIMKFVEKRKQSNQLWICTMQELANYSEARRNCLIKKSEKTKRETRLTVECRIDDARYVFPPSLTFKILPPTGRKILSVLIDQKEVRYGEGWRMALTEPYIYVTVCFETALRHIVIKTAV